MEIDPNVPRKSAIINKHLQSEQGDDCPRLSIFELDLTDLCTRACRFCPRANKGMFPNKGEFMSLELYKKLMKELGDLDYSGMIVYSGFSEPLLHKDINEMISMAREHCPKSRIELYTNGDKLTVDKLRELFKHGLSSIHISVYDGPQFKEKFLAMRDEAGLREDQFFPRVRFLTKEEGYGLTLSNRSGHIDFDRVGVEKLKESVKRRCNIPFYTMMVHYTGKVRVCSHDWSADSMVGDLNKSSIMEVWKGKYFEQMRKRLANDDRGFPPCNACDVKGTLMGEEHFEKWKACHKDDDQQRTTG